MWNTDHFGWPITARPYASTSTLERVEVSEVINQIVQRACDFKPAEFKKPTFTTTTTTTTTITTTTTNRSFVNSKANRTRAEDEKDEALKVPVQAAVSYPDLVSLISNFLKRS